MQDLDDGRAAQKARTRAALLQAAQGLLQQGKRPTVEEAAQAIGMSKRTAYRYFTSQDHMLADAALESLRPEFATLLERPREGSTPVERLEALIRAMNRLTPTYENELRIIVRAALDHVPGDGKRTGRVRGQRRMDWVADILAPLKANLPADLYERLAAALATLIGFDVYVLLRDIARLPPRRIDETMVWMGRTLLDATMAEAAERAAGAPPR